MTDERIFELAKLNLNYDHVVRTLDFARVIEREVRAAILQAATRDVPMDIDRLEKAITFDCASCGAEGSNRARRRLRAEIRQAATRDDPFRSAVESMCAMLEEGEWAEHVASTTGKGDPLAQRLEAAITDLHSELGDAMDGPATIAATRDVPSADAVDAQKYAVRLAWEHGYEKGKSAAEDAQAPVELTFDERNALNEAIKQLPSVSALKSLRTKLAAPIASALPAAQPGEVMIRIACMALSGRIHAGNPTKDGRTFKGGGQDVTSDVLKAIIEFVGVGGTHEVTVDDVPKYEIEIRTVLSSAQLGAPK